MIQGVNSRLGRWDTPTIQVDGYRIVVSVDEQDEVEWVVLVAAIRHLRLDQSQDQAGWNGALLQIVGTKTEASLCNVKGFTIRPLKRIFGQR